MFDADLGLRVKPLLRGERQTTDLDRLFLGLRDRSFGRASVREVGDFVAHRGQREKGPVTERVRDTFGSFQVWLRGVLGQTPSPEDVRRAAEANLRLATDAQLHENLGLRRRAAAAAFAGALRKLELGTALTDHEHRVVNYLGGTFIWNPAFTDRDLAKDLAFVLGKAGLLEAASNADFERVAPFLALYVLTVMHGSTVVMEGGGRVRLFAGLGSPHGSEFYAR